MNVTDFKEFLKQAKKVVPKNATLPETENILFGNEWMNVTNLETTLRKKVKGLPEEEFMINFSEFDKLITKLKTGDLSISIIGGNVKIETEKGTFYFKKDEKVENFPITPKLSKDNLKSDDLTAEEVFKIKKAVNYSSDDELRQVMNSVFINKEHIVATDAQFLCFYSRETDSDLEVIIPSKAVSVLEERECKIETDGKVSKLTYEGETEIYFRNVDGTFPMYKQVIPERGKGSFTVKSKDLNDCIDMALLSSNQKSMLVKFSHEVENKKLLITSQDIDRGTSYSNTIGTDSSIGEDIEIGLKGSYVQRILKVEKYKDVSFKYSDSSRSVIINEEILLMPMMINA